MLSLCAYIFIWFLSLGGGLDPVPREAVLWGAWVISSWLLPVTAKQTHGYGTHILLILGRGDTVYMYSLGVVRSPSSPFQSREGRR